MNVGLSLRMCLETDTYLISNVQWVKWIRCATARQRAEL